MCCLDPVGVDLPGEGGSLRSPCPPDAPGGYPGFPGRRGPGREAAPRTPGGGVGRTQELGAGDLPLLVGVLLLALA